MKSSRLRVVLVAVGLLATGVAGCAGVASDPATTDTATDDSVTSGTGSEPSDPGSATVEPGTSSTAWSDTWDEVVEVGGGAYYLGESAAKYGLDDIIFFPSGPYQVEVFYGPCAGDNGDCVHPVEAMTRKWQPMEGGVCQRLEPVLGVPTVMMSNELSLFTDLYMVTVYGENEAQQLELLAQVRPFSETAPVQTLPPPTDEIAAFVDETCGKNPGDMGSGGHR